MLLQRGHRTCGSAIELPTPRCMNCAIRSLLVVVSLMAPTCSHTQPALDSNNCFKPLADFCSWASASCVEYDKAVHQMEDYVARPRGRCSPAGYGTCGELRFSHLHTGFGSTTEFFDSAGTLVAVRRTTDVVNPGSACPNWVHYGRPLSCELQTTKAYCAGPPRKELLTPSRKEALY